MEQLRTVDTSHGQITYTLVRKQVKNLNLRIDGQGQVILSVPIRCPAERADRLILERAEWLAGHLARRSAPGRELPPLPGRETCMELLLAAVERVYPLIRPYGVAFPQVKQRRLRSQWGNCHWTQGYITLNTALCRCPEELRDYVALHELVHFLHHDHQAGFYAVMDGLMPDWRRRRAELKRYTAAL